MKSLLLLTTFFVFNVTQASTDLKATCLGKYTQEKIDHSVKIEVFSVDGGYDLNVQDSTPDKKFSQWRVALENRFIMSRVEFYSYEPIRIRLFFNSIDFSEKGIFMSWALNKGEPFQIKCEFAQEKSVKKSLSQKK